MLPLLWRSGNGRYILNKIYVDLVKDTFPDKEFLTTPMKKEVDRCVLAFEEAVKGKVVSHQSTI